MTNNFGSYNDSALCSKLQRREPDAEQAFAELYARHSQKVYIYCKKVMNNVNDAHDLFQETWMRFHAGMQKSEREIRNAGGYLLKVARNLCLNKKESARTYVALESIPELTLDAHDRRYEQQELVQLIDHALALLDDKYREAFVLRELEGLSYDDMAEICDDTIPALKNRVWRARKQIKETLAPLVAEYNDQR